MKFTQKQKIHSRLSVFVDWIATDKDKVDEIKKQADEVRHRLQLKAESDGIIVAETPYSGSFAKRTGLRRYLQGSSEVEGQDVDIAFILEAKDKNGNGLGCMIHTFEQYLKESYPDSDVGNTKSSARIDFKSSKLGYDIVPLLKTKRDDIQKLIRTTGEERQSSVKKHAEFVKTRNKESNSLPGRVRFNQCVRLLKWWRYHKQTTSHVFTNNGKKVPSILMDLLSAHAYDNCSVKPTYHETLGAWFSFLASEVRRRRPIAFTDFQRSPKIDPYAKWYVGDPVDDTNNIAGGLQEYEIDELAAWLAHARDRIAQAGRHDEAGEDDRSMDRLIELFGKSFKNNCE